MSVLTEHEHPCLMQNKKERREFQASFQDKQLLGHNFSPGTVRLNREVHPPQVFIIVF